MKFNKTKIFSSLALGVLLTTTSCRDDTFADFYDDNSDEFTVTINVGLEGMGASSTRADGDGEVVEETPHIGGASQIDMLIYAVYYDAAPDKDDPNHTPKWEAAPEYGKQYENGDQPFKDEGVTPGYGQTILDVSETLQNQSQGRQPITLTLKKGHEYKVVFWAQNHKTDAFITSDLKKVQMKYKVAHQNSDNAAGDDIYSINNDEARDAFCRSLDLSGDQSNRNITIYLRRPLAQINVGTRGFDFESITRNSDNGEKYLYSKIRINRAARYLNVVTDKVYTTTIEDDESLSSTEAFYTIDYEYSRIPAYWRWDNNSVPEYPSYSIHDLYQEGGAFKTFLDLHKDEALFQGAQGATDDEKFEYLYGKEEFLKVRLFEHTKAEIDKYGQDGKDNFYLPYEPMGSSLNTDESVQNRSEVFKYLSMCYVLTNSSDDYQDVLTNVKVWLAKDENGKDEVEIANLNNVPVQRNHRTNIVGSLLTAQANVEVIVDQDFAGRKIEEGNIQSGEIAEGFYYDAKKQEFQISSLNGLLFFQQLVNGDLTVRQVYKTDAGVSVGEPYPYLSENGKTTYRLKYKSHSQDEFGDKAKVIIYGSKYDEFVNNQKTVNVNGEDWTIKVDKNGTGKEAWPRYNNFPFYGATVKLMADIDLKGIEWIPIGYDCANWDATFNSQRTDYKAGTYTSSDNTGINYITLNSDAKEVSLGNRRVFCGTFDGNGHTIYNMSTKKYGPNLHESAFQDYSNGNKGGPYDNVQWFANGFFGVVGPGAEIKNLRLQNIDVQGNNAVGGVVGQVSSVGFPAKIENCIVDWGTIDAVPLYRGDYNTSNFNRRTMARGVYIGGIVGQFVAKDDTKGTPQFTDDNIAQVTNCEVRNVTIQGYRRVGGIIGAIADQGDYRMGVQDIQLDIKVENNNIRNSLLIVNQYRAFDVFFDFIATDGKSWQNGFGWGSSGGYSPMSDNIVGGYYSREETINLTDNALHPDYDAFQFSTNNGYFVKDVNKRGKEAYFNGYINSGINGISNLQYCQLSSQPNANNSKDVGKRIATSRYSVIKNIPLEYIPMFTTIFTDEITLENNYYGKTSLHTLVKIDKATLYYGIDASKRYFPINFPNGYDINYDKQSSHTGTTGMYLESVSLDGKSAPGGRSVITPNGVDKENSCAMYVTARDRMQFLVDKSSFAAEAEFATSDDLKNGEKYKKSTNISNVVLRGTPYAWAGLLIAPNHNMKDVNLENVTIYDVYQTIALQKVMEQPNPLQFQNYTCWKKYYYDKNGNIQVGTETDKTDTQTAVNLNAKDCNFRGYTVPGQGWKKISYHKTTFEQGAETRYSESVVADNVLGTVDQSNYKKCKVEAPTDFTNCFFKAPFVIDLTVARQKGYTVNFTSCNATSAYASKEVNPGNNVHFVNIWVDSVNGKTMVDYYDQNGVKLD